MKRFLLASFAILSCTLSVALFGSSSVSASSPFDDNYVTTSELLLGGGVSGNTCEIDNVETSYYSILQSIRYDHFFNEAFMDELDMAVQEGSYFISNARNYANIAPGVEIDQYMILIGANRLPNMMLTFDNDGVIANNQLIAYLSKDYYGDCEYQLVIENNSLAYSSTHISIPEYSGGAWVRNFFAARFIADYPPDYAGPPILETWQPDPVRPISTDTPDVRVPTVIDYKAVMYDANYYTTDQYDHDVCLNGLSPMINWSLRDSTGEFILATTFHLSATLPFEVDLKKLDRQPQDGKYLVIASYFCGDEITDPDFTEYTEVYFNVDEYGSLQIDFFEDCLIGEFPFIDFPACYANVMRVLNLLAFNSINFTGLDQFQRDPGCRSLQVLGGWIHKPGVTVCPMFPQYVRSTVTPFITFAFGLMMLKFITSRGGSGI